MEDIFVEIWIDGQWRKAARLSQRGAQRAGVNAPTALEYDLDYALTYLGQRGMAALSVRHPVHLQSHALETWPSFLLDLLPQGAAMKYITTTYGFPDNERFYWTILTHCPILPPGNLRLVNQEGRIPGVQTVQGELSHPGFPKSDVIQKGEFFLEHMKAHGAAVYGASGAGGAAPKYLLRECKDGRFHADGSLPDNRTKNFWLVKYPRARSENDRMILRLESTYARIAKDFGLHVYKELPILEQDVLFVPRFDRFFKKNQDGKEVIQYRGLESLYSAVGSLLHGETRFHEEFLACIALHTTKKEANVLEYLKREILSELLADTDNHGRNTSLIKSGETINLSPLYDMAPMAWDSEGITRTTRWRHEQRNLHQALLELKQSFTELKVDEIARSLVTFIERLDAEFDDCLKHYNISALLWEKRGGENRLLVEELTRQKEVLAQLAKNEFSRLQSPGASLKKNRSSLAQHPSTDDFCKMGAKCRNPNPEERPTKLRGARRHFGTCSHCHPKRKGLE